MNRHAPPPGAQAVIRYGAFEFQVLRPGSFVRCAITGRPIPLRDLVYWNVERQEAYADALVAAEAYRRYELK